MNDINNGRFEGEVIFDDPEVVNGEELINPQAEEIDFDNLPYHLQLKYKEKKKSPTKPKNLTKKQRQTRTKLVKQSRRRNRH